MTVTPSQPSAMRVTALLHDTPRSSKDMAVSNDDLSQVLKRLGLEQYHDRLVDNGFETWDVVLDITESDLEEMVFRLGHRRLLQRAIANFRGANTLGQDGLDQGHATSSILRDEKGDRSQDTKAPKRRYRRRPKPDPHAPKRSKTAYVNFADHLRTDPAISAMPFVEIARTVGKRWSLLSAEEKDVWESQAAAVLREYERQMDEYRRTENFRRYQAYLEHFKRKHGPPSVESLGVGETHQHSSYQSARESSPSYSPFEEQFTSSRSSSAVSQPPPFALHVPTRRPHL